MNNIIDDSKLNYDVSQLLKEHGITSFVLVGITNNPYNRMITTKLGHITNLIGLVELAKTQLKIDLINLVTKKEPRNEVDQSVGK